MNVYFHVHILNNPNYNSSFPIRTTNVFIQERRGLKRRGSERRRLEWRGESWRGSER
jgi:hypothetical protein